MRYAPLLDAEREASRASRIAASNDAFREVITRHPANGMLVLSRALTTTNWNLQERLLDAVRSFDRFPVEDDPYGEHDFGAFTLDDENLFWKIDVYGSPECFEGGDPLDPAAFRVLTIMFAEDW